MTEVATSSRLDASPTRPIASRGAAATMDAVVSRSSADHDTLGLAASSPVRSQTPPPPSSGGSVKHEIIVAGANILHTPRRGRRVGLDMWDSPAPREVPQTFPRLEKRPSTFAGMTPTTRATRARRDSFHDVSSISPSRRSVASVKPAPAPTSVTPRKRRAPASSSGPAPTLLDDDAWAAAGMRGAPPQPNFLRSATASPGSSQDAAAAAAAKRPTLSMPRYDFLALFCGSSEGASFGESQESVLPLVPIDVGERGRLIVQRSLAPLFAGSEASGSFDASSLLRHSDTEASHNSGASTAGSSTSTAATSIYETPSGNAASGPSPSFSLQSQFPASTHGGSPSPTPKLLRKNAGDEATPRSRGSESVAQVLARTQASLSSNADGTRMPQQHPSSSKGLSDVELLSSIGSLGSDPRLPTLEWPDDPDGPWACSAQHVAAQRAVRLGGIARWLNAPEDELVLPVHSVANDVSELTTPLEPASFYAKPEDAQPQVQQHHQHPMIAKALRDRARREAMARSHSLPNLHASGRTHSPRKRARRAAGAAKLVKADSKTCKRLERKLAGAAVEMAALDAKAAALTAAATAAASSEAAERFSRPRRSASTRRASALEGITTPQALSNRASAAASRAASVVGCQCGHTEALGGMVQCDVCNMWFHLFCLGIAHAAELDDEWFCDGCCERAMTLTPGSFDSGSVCATIAPGSIDGSLAGTPSSAMAHQAHSLMQLEHGQLLPVFSQPSESPAMHSTGRRRFGALALAPSPRLAPVPGAVAGSGGSSGERRSAIATGRARANRIGWHVAEAGSPLERKSQHAQSTLGLSSNGQSSLPSTPSRKRIESFNLEDPFATPSLFSGDTLPHSSVGVEHESSGSPRAQQHGGRSSNVVTPSRVRAERGRSSVVASGAGSGGSSGRRATHARFTHGLGSSDDESSREADDVFGTPSRIYGAPWAAHPRAPAAGALQTPGRRGSTWGLGGGLGTPSSGLLGAAFADASHTHGDASSTAYSGGMPSLVFSSGAMEPHHLDAAGGESRWVPQSPTSATRAGARARQSNSGSALLRTPDLQPRRIGAAATSSVRGSAPRRVSRGMPYDEDTEPPSSSPFPRTPTFDDAGPSVPPFSTLPGSDGSPRGLPGSASRRLARLASSGGEGERKATPQQHGHSGKVRNASSDLNLGLGIGLDFEELLDWN